MAFLLTALGIAAAIGVFVLAARLVAHARDGTRRIRLLHHDPRAPHTAQQVRDNDGRDIKQ